MENDNFILKDFLDNAFNLRSHLMEYLSIRKCDLDGFLANAKMDLANSHPGDTLKLQHIFSRDLVLDFGGGIGTHALANAMSSKVEHVFFCRH